MNRILWAASTLRFIRNSRKYIMKTHDKKYFNEIHFIDCHRPPHPKRVCLTQGLQKLVEAN